MDLHQMLNEFQSYLAYEKCVSKNTYLEYVRDVKQFCDFVIRNNIFKTHQLNKKLTNDFRIELMTKKISPRTISRKITSLREFFRFLKVKYNFEEIQLTAPKFDFKLPQYFHKTEIVSIVDFMKQDQTSTGIRNQLMFNLSYATGVRVTELANIKLNEINLNIQIILITGKGNKQRYVPIPKSMKKDIKKYIKKIRQRLFTNKKQNSDLLFFSIHKNKPKKFSRQGIWTIFRQIGEKLKIKLYPHKIRHSLATHLLENGANLPIIKRILGHESINTTSIYTHLDVKHLRKSYDKSHPRR